MKILLIGLSMIFIFDAFSQVNPYNHDVSGYKRKDGTYVKSYKRTNPNYTNRDNYTTKPNTNPFTGKKGYIEPDGGNGYLPLHIPYTSQTKSGDEVMQEMERTIEMLGGNNFEYDIVGTHRKNRLEEEERLTKLKSKPFDPFYLSAEDWLVYHKYKYEFSKEWTAPKAPEGFISYTISSANKTYNRAEQEQRAINYHNRYSHEDRLYIEEFLSGVGLFFGTVDGYFTDKTIQAIKELQKILGVSVDGNFGRETLDALTQID